MKRFNGVKIVTNLPEKKQLAFKDEIPERNKLESILGVLYGELSNFC